MKEAAERGDTSYKPGDLPQELQDFFYMREVLWPYESGSGVQNAWPYMLSLVPLASLWSRRSFGAAG